MKRGQAHRARGFTLTELMIAVVVLSILAAIAIPNYTAYVNRSKRAAAKAVLLDVANQLERNFTTNGCYNKTTVAVCQSQAAGSNFALPTTLAPSEGRASYVITVAFGGAAGQQYTLTATPCGTAGTCPAGSDNFTDAECGALTLTQAGARGITGTGTVANCWQR
ncbi:MAG TPA: type IV pilin protein [Burkholderiaceae bacterium]|jgi:type IV pilus assembly protein PilE|nr:type IV pilin protein [Burkholderiaceae bacterium]